MSSTAFTSAACSQKIPMSEISAARIAPTHVKSATSTTPMSATTR
jgi:hypothetical protein